jgi:uncharacterized phage-associated protein
MEKQELQVGGITRRDFEQWKHEPVTKLFRRYLADKQTFIERYAIDRWLSGTISLQEDQTLRGHIVELAELSDLPFEALVEFYKEDEERANAASTN